MKDSRKYTFKKGDLIKVKRTTPWQTSEFGWDGPDPAIMGSYGIVLEPHHSVFHQPYGYNTWKVRLTNGKVEIFTTNDLILAAES